MSIAVAPADNSIRAPKAVDRTESASKTLRDPVLVETSGLV